MILTKENYFSAEANMKYMSNSQFKGFLDCEAMQMARLSGAWEDPDQTALLVGKYVHAWNEGVLDQFKENTPEILVKNGLLIGRYIDALSQGLDSVFIDENPEVLTTVGKLRSEFLKTKQKFDDMKQSEISLGTLKTEMTLLGDFKKADEIIEIIKATPLFMTALSGQKEVIFTAEMFGCHWKIMLDSYMPDERRFADLKILKKIKDKFWSQALQIYENVFEYRGYFTQMAIYAEIERLANKRDSYFEPFLAIASKQKYPDKEVVSFVSEEQGIEEFVPSQLLMVERFMPRILAVKSGASKANRCGECDYCLSTKKLIGTRHYTNFNLH